MKVKKRCDHCGASMMEHRHNLSRAMAEGLKRLYEFGAPVNIKHLQLTRNQWDNFQKLRYWGLVEKSYDPTGKRIGGYWQITDKGKEFLSGKISLPKISWTYRGEFVRSDGQNIHISEVDINYKTRPEYAEESRPHEEYTGEF